MSQHGPPSPTWAAANQPKAHKRKRLAKACDACHRSKRRCDGTSPCANCDFAGKVCTYTDPTGRAVAPPRSRPDPASQEDSPQATWGYTHPAPYPTKYPHGNLATPVDSHINPIFALQSSSPLDPDLTRELINIFFAHNQPYALMIHRPTFQYNLARNAVPHYLLNAIFAVAAPLSIQPRLRTTPLWHAGDRFFQAACSLLFNQAGTLACKPSLEVAQSLCLLQAHGIAMHRPDDRYLRLAFRTLDELGVPLLDNKPHTPSEYDSVDLWIVRESCRRTFWYIHMIELLSSAFAQRTLSVSQSDLRVYLPVTEACFELATPSTTPPELMAFSAPLRENPSEFGQLLRVTSIYSATMNYLTEKELFLRQKDPRAQGISISNQEQSLTSWLQTLPNHLKFNRENLQVQLSTMDTGATGSSFCFAYMHAIAECAVLGMYEFSSLGRSDVAHTEREKKAIENLVMILMAVGPRGRVNLMMATPLLAIGKHCAVGDSQVASWFQEYERMWGVSLDQLLDQVYRSAWCTIGTGEQYGDAPSVIRSRTPPDSTSSGHMSASGGVKSMSSLESLTSAIPYLKTGSVTQGRSSTPIATAISTSGIPAPSPWDRDAASGHGHPPQGGSLVSAPAFPFKGLPLPTPISQTHPPQSLVTSHYQADHLPRRDVRSISSLTSSSPSPSSLSFSSPGPRHPGSTGGDQEVAAHLQSHPFALPSLRASFPDSSQLSLRGSTRPIPVPTTATIIPKLGNPPSVSSTHAPMTGVRTHTEEEKDEDAEGSDDTEVVPIAGGASSLASDLHGPASLRHHAPLPQPSRMPVGMAWLDAK